MFGVPSICVNGEKISLPFKKAEALFFYLVLKRQDSRENLINMFWGWDTESKASKKLRDTIYRIKKSFNFEILISPQKSIIMVNPDVPILTDVEMLLSDRSDSIKFYKGDFLDGLYLKNECGNFEEWVMSKREYFKSIYTDKLLNKMNESVSTNNGKATEYYAKLLIAADEYEERAYRVLMKKYIEADAYHKAIEVYLNLCKILSNELGVEPDNKTKILYKEILAKRKIENTISESISRTFFYGREKEIDILRENYIKFKNNISFKSVLLIGEAGIGKTRLKDKFLEELDLNDIYLLSSNCFEAEKNYFFKPWDTIFSKISDIISRDKIEISTLWRNAISCLFPIFDADGYATVTNPIERLEDFKYRGTEEAIIGLLKKLNQNKKVVLVFEDIQWMNSASLNLLNYILFHKDICPVFLIASYRTGYGEGLDIFFNELLKNDFIEKVELSRFTQKEVNDFISKALPDLKITSYLKDRIFKETEGNTFFLIEYLNSINNKRQGKIMTSKMKDVLRSRYIGISDEGMKFLNIASMFFDRVSLSTLNQLTNKKDIEILDIMDEIIKRSIVSEIDDDNNIFYEFTHQKLREFIYMQISQGKRRIIHNKIGEMLEKDLKNDKSDVDIYPKLIHHFTCAKNKLAALKYTIKYLNLYLDFNHELFPAVNGINNEGLLKSNKSNIANEIQYEYFTGREILKYLKNIQKLFDEVKKSNVSEDEIIAIQIELLYIEGRYSIKEGKYDNGIMLIKYMINLSFKINDSDSILKGYRELIYYYIQTYNINYMCCYIEKALYIARNNNNKSEIAMLLRLKGLNNIMSANYSKAEQFIYESLSLFKEICEYDDKYYLNIAACYNYLGEIRRCMKKFKESMEYYDKAIDICDSKKVLRGVTIFNTNAGQAAFGLGDYNKAKRYFKRAINLYNQLDVMWGRAIAEGYMALVYIMDDNYEAALNSLLKADKYVNKVNSPYAIGLIYKIKFEIKKSMLSNENLNSVFLHTIDLPLDCYRKEGIYYLKKVKNCYEIEALLAT